VIIDRKTGKIIESKPEVKKPKVAMSVEQQFAMMEKSTNPPIQFGKIYPSLVTMQINSKYKKLEPNLNIGLNKSEIIERNSQIVSIEQINKDPFDTSPFTNREPIQIVNNNNNPLMQAVQETMIDPTVMGSGGPATMVDPLSSLYNFKSEYIDANGNKVETGNFKIPVPKK